MSVSGASLSTCPVCADTVRRLVPVVSVVGRASAAVRGGWSQGARWRINGPDYRITRGQWAEIIRC